VFPDLFKKEENDFVLNKLYDDLINKNELCFDLLQLLSLIETKVSQRRSNNQSFHVYEKLRFGNETFFLNQKKKEDQMQSLNNKLDYLNKVFNQNFMACRFIYKFNIQNLKWTSKDFNKSLYEEYLNPGHTTNSLDIFATLRLSSPRVENFGIYRVSFRGTSTCRLSPPLTPRERFLTTRFTKVE
jgi:hypothetical protein